MNEKTKNIFKAFITGFLTISLLLLLMHLLAPTLGMRYEANFQSSFEFLSPTSGNILYVSLMAPLIVGVIFAVFQFFDDYEGHMHKHYRKVFKTPESEEIMIIVSDTLCGMAIGFVTTMILFIYLAGKTGTYTVPYLFSATVSASSVSGQTTIISIWTIIGLVYGVWKAHNLKKRKKGKAPRKPASK